MMLPGFEMVGRHANVHTHNSIIVDVVQCCQFPAPLIQLIKGNLKSVQGVSQGLECRIPDIGAKPSCKSGPVFHLLFYVL